MKMVQKLSLLALVIFTVSCNEKVSPELQQSNATTPDSTTPVAPGEFYFAIENSSAALLNYKLHKTGAGNSAATCEVRNTTGLSSDIFRGDPATNDITCYYDAEELSLFHAGFNFKIKASQNTCDFIGYSPFGFYDRIPGDSTGEFIEATCTNETTNSTHLSAAALALGVDIKDFSNTDIGCGEWISDDVSRIPQGTRRKFTPTSDEELCRFNYKDGDKEKCDVGTIVVNELSVTYTPANGTTPAVRKEEIIPRVITCGGAVANCVQGPVKVMSKDSTNFIEVTQAELNKPFELEYKYKGLIGKKSSTKSYANFRRNLASTNINYLTSAGLTPAYKAIWSDPTFGKIFEPRVLDYFSANVTFDGTANFISGARLETEAVRNNMWFALPLAADPFMGMSGRVNPFYTMYCLDTALDIKARIRMMVRDWDRVFPSNADNEFISDLYRGANARQDAPTYVELPGDLDGVVLFNDLGDWDDKVPMTRTGGAFDPSTTIYQPNPTATFLDGWFNPAYFTNNGY